MQQKASALATQIDRNLLSAQSICSAIDSSENFRSLYQTRHIAQNPVDSVQLYRVLSELTRIKSYAGNLNTYSLMLGFEGDDRLYAPGAVIELTGRVSLLPASPWLGISSVSELLGVESSNITVNKRFLIYADDYSSYSGGSIKGVSMILLELPRLEALAVSQKSFLGYMEICCRDEAVYSAGEADDSRDMVLLESLVSDEISYRFQASREALRVPFPARALLPVGVIALLGIAALYAAYRYMRLRYRPIGDITRMVVREESPAEKGQDELESIMKGVSDLIGERNGYREQMLTISPYASHGALHQLLSGNLQASQMELLREEQFWALRHAYFAVGILNLATQEAEAAQKRLLDAQALAAQACRELSDEELTVVSCPRDVQNLYIVVNVEQREQLSELFYALLPRIREGIDDANIEATIGVSGVKHELGELRKACDEAAAALENILTGGRGSVYFFGTEADEEKDYELPHDTRKRIVKSIRENNENDLDALLDGIWEKNIVKASLSPEAVRAMVDELHSSIDGAMRDLSEKSTTHIRVERVREPATIEEIFAYYRSLLHKAAQAYREEVADDADNEALEQEICQYINENILNPELSLTAVADHFGVSGKLVGAVCKNNFGKTYLQYVRDCQIQQAVKLLQTTDLPLEEIATQCGFTNLLTFRRNFKAVMNMNPSDFRTS